MLHNSSGTGAGSDRAIPQRADWLSSRIKGHESNHTPSPGGGPIRVQGLCGCILSVARVCAENTQRAAETTARARGRCVRAYAISKTRVFGVLDTVSPGLDLCLLHAITKDVLC